MYYFVKASRNYFNLSYNVQVIMTTISENVIVREISTRTQGDESVEQRMSAVRRRFNSTKYNVLGFINRTSQVVLEPRFYNVRDSKGRWAKVREIR
jgi:hypothetical protein